MESQSAPRLSKEMPRNETILSSGESTDIEANPKENPTVSASEEDDDGKPHFPAWQWILTMIGLYLGALLYGLDTTIAADIQTAVYERFGNIEDLAWVGLGFPMGSVAGIMFIGRLYDMYDIKWLMNASVLTFEVGSAVCGSAPNMNALIVGRVVAGVGGCGMYIGLLQFVSALGAPRKLTMYNALIGVCWGTGAILGPVVGGAFAKSSATWRWAFYINLPLAALCAPIYIFVIPSWKPQPGVKNKLHKFDWLGVIFNAGTFVLFITVVTFAGARFAWSSSVTIGLFTAWGVTLAAYILQQRTAFLTTAAKRLFPVHFLHSLDLILLYIATACTATGSALPLYYVPILFVFTRGDDPLKAAVRLLPFIVVFIVTIMIAGASLPLIGRYAPYYTLGGALILTGSALMFTIDTSTSVSTIYGYEVLIAAGAGITFQNAYAVAAAKVSDKDKLNAIGFINTAQIGTTAIALALASCLYQNLGVAYLRDALAGSGVPEPALRAMLGGAASEALGAVGPEVARKAIETIVYTISRVFGLGIAAGGLMFVVSLVMKRERLDLAVVAGG